MRAPLSIVIPTLDAAADLPATLGALFEGLESGLVRELVISDGDSQDATANIAQEAGAVLVSGPPGRGGQLHRGAKAARGEWILFLHDDTHLAPGWSRTVLLHMKNPNQAGYFGLRFRTGGFGARFVAGWANLRSRLGLPYGDQGLLISRQLYDQIGGYREIPLMEDVAIARSLRGHLVRLDGYAHTGADKYLREGWLRRGTRNLWNLVRYWAWVDPEILAKQYRR